MQDRSERDAGLAAVSWKRVPYATRIERVVSVIETWLNYVGVYLIMFLMFFATGGVIGRYFFNRPFSGYWDLAEMMLVAVVFFGIAYTQRTGGHIRVELFLTRAIRGRAYHIIEFFTSLLSLVVFAFIASNGLERALYSYAHGDVTAAVLWPTWPSMMCVPIGSFLLCIRFFIQMFQHLLQVVSTVESKNPGLRRQP